MRARVPNSLVRPEHRAGHTDQRRGADADGHQDDGAQRMCDLLTQEEAVRLLRLDQQSEGEQRTTHWVDQRFEIHYKGKRIATFGDTAEYRAAVGLL